MESVHELRAAHLEEAVRFVRGQIFELRGVRGCLEEMLPLYRWLYVETPRRRDDFIGWGLRNQAGELVGTHLIAWQHYIRAGRVARGLVSTNSYVMKEYRGPRGLELMLNMTRRAEADLCLCTTANVSSGSVWKSMRGLEMAGAGWEFLIPVNWTAWAVAGMVRKVPFPVLKRLLDGAGRFLPAVRRRFTPPAGYKVEELRPGEIPCANPAPLTDKWEPLRDPEWLSWRYAACPGPSVKLIRLSRSTPGRDLFVGIRTGPRGFGRGLRQMVLMDVHGGPETDGMAVIAALAEHFAGSFELIGVRLLAAMLWEAQLAAVARRRVLEFPTHWMLSRKMPLSVDDWRPSHGDGDAAM
jgi:hypothetical protein